MTTIEHDAEAYLLALDSAAESQRTAPRGGNRRCGRALTSQPETPQ